jgi:hypothetical protein
MKYGLPVGVRDALLAQPDNQIALPMSDVGQRYFYEQQVYIHICMYININVYIQICIFTSIYTYMYLYIYIYVYVYICIYIIIYTTGTACC